MKENIYDNEAFFAQYSKFPRSVEGLNAAGEWHELQKLLPSLHNKRVLDIGCGFGWHCIYAAEHGAQQVVGIDISENMLRVAREKTLSPIVTYSRMAMEDMEYPDASFDVVLSSLAFHYTQNFLSLCEKIHRSLASNGMFVFSIEHPVFTAYGNQDWIYDTEGNRAHWPVDRYFMEGERTATFLNNSVIKYHKTITTYLSVLLHHGFSITGIVEPQPAEHLLHTVPKMQDELRRPMMLLLSAQKKY